MSSMFLCIGSMLAIRPLYLRLAQCEAIAGRLLRPDPIRIHRQRRLHLVAIAENEARLQSLHPREDEPAKG